MRDHVVQLPGDAQPFAGHGAGGGVLAELGGVPAGGPAELPSRTATAAVSSTASAVEVPMTKPTRTRPIG
ncbi:hypothetical protein [Kitasatospora cheerisanensis]|uniref:hypothetical protein n=1 Tax=Kitasatospora cheerisanensis TaxID=81942 RepID=UPI00313447E7